jgi:hypothetical protein
MMIAGFVHGEARTFRLGQVIVVVRRVRYLVLIGATSAAQPTLAPAPRSPVRNHAYVNPVVAVLLGALVRR